MERLTQAEWPQPARGYLSLPTPLGCPSPAGRPSGRPGPAVANCLTSRGIRIAVTYQPASRYWPLQWTETGIYLVLSLALAGYCFHALGEGDRGDTAAGDDATGWHCGCSTPTRSHWSRHRGVRCYVRGEFGAARARSVPVRAFGAVPFVAWPVIVRDDPPPHQRIGHPIWPPSQGLRRCVCGLGLPAAQFNPR